MPRKEYYNPFDNASDVIISKKGRAIVKIINDKTSSGYDRETRVIYPMTEANLNSFNDYIRVKMLGLKKENKNKKGSSKKSF